MLLGKPRFSTIKNFSLANRLYRHIAFQRFFSYLCCTTKSQWTNLHRIPGVTSWTRFVNIRSSHLPLIDPEPHICALICRYRSLECTTASLYVHTDQLLKFSNLHCVSIDFDAEGLGTHHNSSKLILSNLPPQISRLDLLHVPSITTYLLSLISTSCLQLESLVIRCSDCLLPDCCWNCYDEAGSRAVHSPIPEHYCDAESLAVHGCF